MKKKILSSMVAAAILATSLAPAFAMKNVSLTVENNIATVTAEDVDRIAIAQYDKFGALKAFGISSLMGEKQTATLTFDKDYNVNVFSFTDWNTLKSDEAGVKIGQKTLVYCNFDDVKGSYVVNDLGYEINKMFETTDREGNVTNALLIRGTTDGTPFNVQFGGAASEESDYVVFEYDLRLNNLETTYNSYIKSVKRDGEAAAWQTLWCIKPDNAQGETIEFGATKVSTKTIEKDKWYRLSAIVDYNLETIKFYMDKEYLGEEDINSDINAGTNSPDIFYIHGPINGSTDFMVDNVRVYEGTDIRDTLYEKKLTLDVTKPTIVDPDETELREILLGSFAFHIRSGVAIDRNGNKTIMENAPYTEEETIFVHLADICKAWGIETPADVMADGKGYVILTDLATALGLNIYTPEAIKNSGLVILADSFDAPDNMQSLNNFGFYLRPTNKDILKAYNKSTTKNVHPRLFATQSDFDRIRAMYDAGTDEAFMAWAEDVIQYADSRMDKEPPEFSEMSSSGRTLQRTLKGDVYAWAMAYHLTGDEKYADRVVEELTYFCDFDTWYPDDHLHIIETMDAFAIGYDWLYNEMTSDERKLIEESMYEMGFKHCYEAFRSKASAMGSAFYGSNNHGTVCNGGMTMAAVAFMDIYPDECAWFVSGAMKGMEYNIDKWNTGAWYEGAGYWEYALAYTVKFIESLRGAFGTDFGFSSLEGLDMAAEKEIGMHGALGIYNYADAGLGKYYSPEMMWLGSEYNNSKVATKVVKEYNGKFPQNHRRSGESVALALLWYNPEMIGEDATFKNDYFYEDLDVITMREGWNDTDTFVGVKAGVLNEAHSQLDSGSFIFESDGIRWLQDMGAGSYMDGYFETKPGGRRWQFIQNRAEGHNTVIVNPGDNEDMNVSNNGAKAEMTLVESNDKGAIVTVDLKQVLFDTNAATRGFFFTDNRQSLVVRDEIQVSSLPVYENFDGKTHTNIFGTYESNYELVSGAEYSLPASDTVAKLTGNNRNFNNNKWDADTGTKDVTYEFDLYVEPGAVFQLYPTASNRYGMQISGSTIYALLPNWETTSTGKTMPTETWHHFKVEYDFAQGMMFIYMDNTLIHTQTGLDTNALAPVDHYFNGSSNGKAVLVNNLQCYTNNTVGKTNIVYWHLIPDNDAAVVVDGDTNTITMTKDGKTCYIEYAVEGGTIAEEKFEKPIVSIIENAQPIADRYGRVVLKINAISNDITITAKITPESATDVTPLSDYMSAISDWKLN